MTPRVTDQQAAEILRGTLPQIESLRGLSSRERMSQWLL